MGRFFQCVKKRSGNRGKMKTVADPERRRWRIGITIRSVERFSPLQGDILGVPENRRFLGKRSGK